MPRRRAATIACATLVLVCLAAPSWPYQAVWGAAAVAGAVRDAAVAGWHGLPPPQLQQPSSMHMPQAASQPSPAAAASAARGEPRHAGSSAAGVSGSDRALASCLYPLGGGDTRAGHGDFPVAAAMRHACVQRIAHYLDAQYDVDVDTAIDAARLWFDTKAAAEFGPPKRDQLIVFDIDETVLCNIKNSSLDWTQLRGPAWLGGLREWQLRGAAPAIQPSLALYRDLWSAGYSVTFLTGRPEQGRQATERNLADAGYGRRCTDGDRWPSGAGGGGVFGGPKGEPCWVQLDMRAPGDAGTSATVYKGGRRQRLQDEGGYTILASFGDQFSDLSGIAPAAASFKMPNPVYYII